MCAVNRPAGPRRAAAARGAAPLAAFVLVLAGCDAIVRHTDRDIAAIIRERQRSVLDREAAADLGAIEDWKGVDAAAYKKSASATRDDVPAAFREPAPRRAPRAATTQAGSSPASQPATSRSEPFTLTAALAFAQENRRAFQAAKETLYIATLALTLERHLWTPILAQNFTTVYGNYGEARQFDQAMRFVHDASVSQRLPYGGELTAGVISTLVRDVKKSLTATEGSTANVTARIPLLRGAGMVSQEQLIQLERELTYSVRVYERFRRQQLVEVAQNYFDLLRQKQAVINSDSRYRRAIDDYERAKALEGTGKGTPLDTQRAEQSMLSAENSLERERENFRSQADDFKLLIGMPVDQPLGLADLEDIGIIEQRIDDGQYPILMAPQAINEPQVAEQIALDRRLDLLTLRDRIDDSRRGVEISRNALLPRLDWEGSATTTTDPDRYSMSHFHVENTNWLTQITLEVPWERQAEKNELRRSLIDVRAAQRDVLEQTERIRAEVRRVVNLLRLAEISLEIQRRSVEVAERQREFAQLQFEEGLIDNRDKVEAEDDLLAAQNALNEAKTARWGLVLQFRLATETLRVEEDGSQGGESA